jgi:hypothetical protein
VWHLVLIVWSNRIRNCKFYQYLLQRLIFLMNSWQLNCLSINMSVKQMKPFMTNVFLNSENEISDFLVASSINRVIELKQKIWNFLEFITKIFFFLHFVNKIEFLINRSIQRKWNIRYVVLHLGLIVWLKWITKCNFF